MNKILNFILFFTIFLAIYGGLHFYFYRKVTRAFEMGTACHLLLILVLLFLLMSPVIMNMSSNSGRYFTTSVLAYVGYFWMAVLFLFFSMNIMIDLYRLIIYISARWFSPAFLRYIPGDRVTFITVLLIIAGINLYGWFEAGNIGVERIRLNTNKLPPQVRSMRLVQISDTHFSSTNGMRLAREIGKIVRGLEPDIIVSTGDLIEKDIRDVDSIASIFKDLVAPYGKYATTGNHEFIAGIEKGSEFIKRAGFKLLRNECVKAGDFLNIAAIDDPAVASFGNEPVVSEDRVLEALSPDRLNIFLKHQPRIQANSIGKFDIQLSGHTHKGQIFPFTLIVHIFYPYLDGLFDLGKGSYLYVTRGAGTWGPPIRFLTFPEITVIEFVRN